MKTEVFEKSVTLPVSAAGAFAWHEHPGALQALTPPWERIRVRSVSHGIRDGSHVVLTAYVGPLWLIPTTWEMEHHGYVAGREFNDRMLRGPFALWEHRHAFADIEPDGEGRPQCVLTDTIRYRLPFGFLGRFFGAAFTRRKLTSMFAWRHAATLNALGS